MIRLIVDRDGAARLCTILEYSDVTAMADEELSASLENWLEWAYDDEIAPRVIAESNVSLIEQEIEHRSMSNSA